MSRLQDRLNAVNNVQQNANQVPKYEQPSFENEKIIYEAPKTEFQTFRDRFGKIENTIEEELSTNNDAFSEEMLEAEELKRLHNAYQQEQKEKRMSKTVSVILTIACVYIIFLIYGVIVTDYKYNDEGVIVPQIMSVEDIKEKKQFDVIVGQYENCRMLYEKTLMLDYRLGQGIEDPMIIAPEYEALLDEVENLSIKTDALEVDTQYTQVKMMLLSWVQNDIAIYLQKMSSAISQNNSEDANTALVYQTQMYNNFSLITQNVVAMGESINGTDMTEIKQWSPETYVNNTINSQE